MYSILPNGHIKRDDGAFIAPDSELPINPDYAEYLAWVAAGNIPKPFDPRPNPRRDQILARLDEIDRQSVRALRAKVQGRGNQADNAVLEAYEDEATALRAELAGLGA